MGSFLLRAALTGFALWEMLVKLVIAIVLGGLIGLERETHGRPAGLYDMQDVLGLK